MCCSGSEISIDWSRQSFRTQVFAPLHNWDLNSSNQVLISTGAWKRKPSRQSGPRRQKRGVLPRGLDWTWRECHDVSTGPTCLNMASRDSGVKHTFLWDTDLHTHADDKSKCIHYSCTFSWSLSLSLSLSFPLPLHIDDYTSHIHMHM